MSFLYSIVTLTTSISSHIAIIQYNQSSYTQLSNVYDADPDSSSPVYVQSVENSNISIDNLCGGSSITTNISLSPSEFDPKCAASSIHSHHSTIHTVDPLAHEQDINATQCTSTLHTVYGDTLPPSHHSHFILSQTISSACLAPSAPINDQYESISHSVEEQYFYFLTQSVNVSIAYDHSLHVIVAVDVILKCVNLTQCTMRFLDPKRRSERLTWCRTLAQFHIKVKEGGLEVAQSTLYHRLLPRREGSIQAQCHVPTQTIPVKLVRPKENEYGHHPSTRYCLAQSRQNKQFASVLNYFYSHSSPYTVPIIHCIITIESSYPIFFHSFDGKIILHQVHENVDQSQIFNDQQLRKCAVFSHHQILSPSTSKMPPTAPVSYQLYVPSPTHQSPSFILPAATTITCNVTSPSFIHISLDSICNASFCIANDFIFTSGPTQCAYLGIDDKAKVPLGIAACNKQQSMLMRMDYNLKLPDHPFAVTDKHKLIPSVYADCNIDANKFADAEAVTYSGPTYIVVRSGKHDSSTTFDHGRDVMRMYAVPDFKQYLYTANKPKPVLIVRTDGGPDQILRNFPTIKVYYNHFKKLDLDMLLVSMSAPNASAYNEVERRMSPLSEQIVVFVLVYLILGIHLDGNGKTIDDELEKNDFAEAGKILAEIWDSLTIDGYKVKSEFISPISKSQKKQGFTDWDETFADKHIQFDHFHLSNMKCQDPSCCGDILLNFYDVLQSNIYPATIFYTRNNGILALGKKYSNSANHAQSQIF